MVIDSTPVTYSHNTSYNRYEAIRKHSVEMKGKLLSLFYKQFYKAGPILSSLYAKKVPSV
jgi:hypothetical protein